MLGKNQYYFGELNIGDYFGLKTAYNGQATELICQKVGTNKAIAMINNNPVSISPFIVVRWIDEKTVIGVKTNGK